MYKAKVQKEALRLPPDQRLELADALYSSLEPEPLTGWQREVLRERLEKAEAHPERFSSWDEAKRRIQLGRRRTRRV
ncbi:MAG: addiction module protein [Acidobacteriota bacterium]